MTVAREGFDLDLRHGNAREDALVNVFLRARVEVKSDGWCERTGNLAVEYEQKGRPSGIATTDADWWAFEYQPDRWLIVPTDVVKDHARRAIRDGQSRLLGDDNRYRCALVPIAWFVAAVKGLAADELPEEAA